VDARIQAYAEHLAASWPAPTPEVIDYVAASLAAPGVRPSEARAA
jgi:hypothetical protein